MKIYFSEHAQAQLAERRLTERSVTQTVEDPKKRIQQSAKRFRVQRFIRKGNKKYLLLIVYDIVNDTKEVVTAFVTRKFKKYL